MACILYFKPVFIECTNEEVGDKFNEICKKYMAMSSVEALTKEKAIECFMRDIKEHEEIYNKYISGEIK